MSESSLLRIQEIAVDGLFGVYNHCIPLNQNQRVTIIHGPNGIGKTRIMTMTNALLGGDLIQFITGFPPCMLSVLAENGRLLVRSHETQKLSIRMEGPDQDPVEGTFQFPTEYSIREVPAHLLADLFDKFNNKLSWYHAFCRAVKTTLVGIDRLKISSEHSNTADFSGKGGSVRVGSFAASTGVVTSARAGSVTSDSQQQYWTPAVSRCQQQMKDRYQELFARYGEVSGQLERTMAQRLIDQTPPSFRKQELVDHLQSLTKQDARLVELGILDEAGEEVPFHQIDDSVLPLLTRIVQDREKKNEVLDEFARRLEVFIESLNSKFLEKRIQFDRKQGILAETARGERLDLTDLSSGEQHEIVLLFKLLFDTRPNTLVMIDEPELSLHITWQKRFVDDMLRIAALSQIDILLATHSPDIAGDHEDLMVDLKAIG